MRPPARRECRADFCYDAVARGTGLERVSGSGTGVGLSVSVGSVGGVRAFRNWAVIYVGEAGSISETGRSRMALGLDGPPGLPSVRNLTKDVSCFGEQPIAFRSSFYGPTVVTEGWDVEVLRGADRDDLLAVAGHVPNKMAPRPLPLVDTGGMPDRNPDACGRHSIPRHPSLPGLGFRAVRRSGGHGGAG